MSRLMSLEERERRGVMEVVDIRLHMDKLRAEGSIDELELDAKQHLIDEILKREAVLPGQLERLTKMADVMFKVVKELESFGPKRRQRILAEVRKTFMKGGTEAVADHARKQSIAANAYSDAKGAHNDPTKYELQRKWIETVWSRVQIRDWLGTDRHKALVAGVDPALPTENAVAEALGELTATLGWHNEPETVRQSLKGVLPIFMGTLEWQRAGYPVFSLTDDFFHALAVTDFGTHEDDKEDVLHLPFPSFIVNFPPNTIMADARKMFIYRGTATTTRLTLATEPALLTSWANDITRWGFFHDEKLDRAAFEKKSSMQTEQYEALFMGRRILANMLSYIDASNGLPKEKHKHGAPAAPVEREHTEPRFRVGRPVKLSPQIRQVLKEGKAGKSWRLGHRFIVRGHFRNQAHGPNRSLRMRKWIEPFWKGPASMTETFERSYSVE